jgi:hypothetical protein
MMPSCAVVVVFSLLSVVFLLGMCVSADTDGDSLRVAAPFAEGDVPLSDITSVEIREDPDFERKRGHGGKDFVGGQFHNSKLSEVTYAATVGRPEDNRGTLRGTLAFNLESGTSTEAFYEGLMSIPAVPPTRVRVARTNHFK